jgi:hypothetical protein
MATCKWRKASAGKSELRTTFLALNILLIRRDRLTPALEELNGALMFFGRLTRVERA